VSEAAREGEAETTVSLRGEALAVAAVGAVGLAGGGGALAQAVSVGAAGRWLAAAAAVAGFELWFLWRSLERNRPAGDGGDAPDGSLGSGGTAPEPYPTLGVANRVTLARGGLFAALGGFAAVAPRPPLLWLPAACYAAGTALDWVDGTLARTRGRPTVLGAKLDLAFDTIGFALAPLVGVLWGRLPVWYLSLAAARYVYRAGVALHRRRGGRVRDLPDSRLRRPLAGLHMACLAVALAPVLPASTVAAVAAVVLPPSLAVFARDLLAVTGRWPRGQEAD